MERWEYTHGELSFQFGLLAGKLGLLLQVVGHVAPGGLHFGEKVVLLLAQSCIGGFEFLALLELGFQKFSGLSSTFFQFADLVLQAGLVDERLHLLPHLEPTPCVQFDELPNVALYHHKSLTLLDETPVLLAGEITSGKGLHPGHDLSNTVISELLHGTQHTGTEEHLEDDIKKLHTLSVSFMSLFLFLFLFLDHFSLSLSLLTLVLPRRYSSGSSLVLSKQALAAFFSSEIVLSSLGARIMYLKKVYISFL